MTTTNKETKEQIILSFERLLQDYKQNESQVVTKEEELEKEKNKQLLEKTGDYTVNNIVNGMATLQLDFGNLTKEIAQRLDNESNSLEDLKKAITVQKETLSEFKKIRLVADALDILRKEHQERLKTLENRIKESHENLEKEELINRKNWEKEANEFAVKIKEEADLILKLREQEEADFNYEIEIERKVRMDDYEETKRNQERELNEWNKDKEKGWQERETILKKEEKEFNDNKKKIEGFEEKLKEEYNKAKGDAIKEADKEAKVKSDLMEKEWEANKQGFEFKIQSLEANVEYQNQQIAEIIAQLQNATNQAQALALKAFEKESDSKAKTN